jgi:hypothetical protein
VTVDSTEDPIIRSACCMAPVKPWIRHRVVESGFQVVTEPITVMCTNCKQEPPEVLRCAA